METAVGPTALDLPELQCEDGTPNTMEAKGLLSHLADCLSCFGAGVY